MPVVLLSAVAAAAAAWLSQGLVAYTQGSHRIGLVPYSVRVVALSAGAGVVVGALVRRGASAMPLFLLALIAVPWLPLPLPPAVLAWSGRMPLFVWVAVLAILAASRHWGQSRLPGTVPATGDSPGYRGQSPLPGTVPASGDSPRWGAAGLAGLLAFLVGGVAFWQVRPALPAGDEPHYLVITQSLLEDGDLRIENNHRRGDYREYFAGDLRPDFRVRGRDGEIYSIHAPGLAGLVAPAFLVAGYAGVVVFLLALSAAGSALAWSLAWRLTQRTDAAWFGWAAATLSTTWIFHSFAVFPDGAGAVLVLTGVWALLRAEGERTSGHARAWPWLLHGAALALLPWMHTRFAALAGTLGALVLLRLGAAPNALMKAAAFIALPLLSAIAWIGYFVSLYGTPDPSAPYGNEPGSFAFVPDGLAGLLFDQRFGLFAYAPVLLAAFAGIGVMLARPPWRRHGVELLFVGIPYLIVVTYVAMWWGGTSAPARFFAPLLPWMALPAACAWTASASRTARVSMLAALLVTVCAAVMLAFVDGGRLAFSTREEYARWLEWLNGSVDLGRGLPIWWRENEVPLFRGIAIWGACAAAGWFVLLATERSRRLHSRAAFSTAAAVVIVLAATAAVTITWAAERVDGRAPLPAQLETLRRLSQERRLLAVGLSPLARLDRGAVPAALRIEPEFSTAPGGAGRNDRPLYAIPAIAAGEYRLRFTTRALDGWVMLGIGRDQFALQTQPLSVTHGTMAITFPVDVRALMVRGDEDARRNIRGLTLEPIRLVAPERRLTREYARRAVHYPGAIVYFLDDRSFPEPEAFWVGGAREASIVVQPDALRPTIPLLLRNGAVNNTVLVQSAGWRDALNLGPGEERRLELPLNHERGATLVRISASAGFTPSAVDPGSRDSRFLGVWVRVVE
jgi:hypothetical protein